MSNASRVAYQFKTAEYRQRAEAAETLCEAIAECHRDEAVVILSAALVSLSMGSPLPVWINAMDDARWWASFATEIELKAYALASLEALRPRARAGVLERLQERAAT